MKKTFGLLALTVGVAAGGCALLPHGPVANLTPKEAQWSGPVTVTVNLPENMRSTQGLRSGVTMVEVYAMNARGQGIATRNSSNIVATASVTGSGAAATITLPALPADGRSFFLVINGYNSTRVPSGALLSDVASGSETISTTTSSVSAVVAQTEAYVTPVGGAGIPLSVTMYNCVANSANLNYNAGASTGMVYASSLSGITPPAGGLPIRWFGWSFGSSSVGLNSSGSATLVRLTVYRPTGAWPASANYPQTQATGAASASYGAWDSATRSAMSSTATSGLVATCSAWNTDSSGKYAYMDINMNGSADSASKSFWAGCGANLSVILPSFFLPTGYVVTLTDRNNPVTLPGNGTL